jgi:hypothetical protein
VCSSDLKPTPTITPIPVPTPKPTPEPTPIPTPANTSIQILEGIAGLISTLAGAVFLKFARKP